MAYDERSKPKLPRRSLSREGCLHNWIGLLQRIGVPLMALVTGYDIDLDAYYYAITSLGSVASNLSSLRWTADYFSRSVLPFAKKYQTFLEMAEEESAIQAKNSNTIEGPIKSIELQSVSFWYSDPEEEHEHTPKFRRYLRTIRDLRSTDDHFTANCNVSGEEYR